MSGMWLIAGNLLRDLAALNNVEMLPWDDWGVMPGPGDEISEDQLQSLDELARLTRDPDRYLAELRDLYSTPAFLVPTAVHNAVLGRHENIL